jgi:hypothetical protein
MYNVRSGLKASQKIGTRAGGQIAINAADYGLSLCVEKAI